MCPKIYQPQIYKKSGKSKDIYFLVHYQMSFEAFLKSANNKELIEVEISFFNELKKLKSREPCTISCTKDSPLGLIIRPVGSRPASSVFK